ncbi:helix-turn-helix transcriptional regulator [Longispora sp. K20-0274]|uniref:LuxR C-terminal-related transcriptional regulator n=1 Tax=Longispora sp. K20-0274 TaxID=3088255 RepID=UPI00399A590D
MLEAFDVDPVAESIYLAMLKSPLAGIAELAERLGWEEDRIRSGLDELARLSLLRPSWENPLAMRPVSPEAGLEILLARQRVDLLRRQHQIEEGQAALQVLIAEYAHPTRGSASTGVEELIGLDAVRERLERLAYQTRHQVLAFAPDGAQTEEALAASRPLNALLLERGVEMRTLYLNSVRNDAPTCAHAEWLGEMGAQVRTVPVLPIRMLLVDRMFAVVPLDLENTAAGAVVVRGAAPVAVMCALFEQIWQTGTPFGDAQDDACPELTDQERALLNLLLQGDTDEQAARKLGVSPRTVGRMGAEIMARLGARSRFQAGALAAERGWLAQS